MPLLTGFKTYLGTVTGAGAVLAFFSLLAKLVGLMLDRILAAQFGASTTLDIYYSAFKIPDFVFNLLVLGAASSAFIPVFLEHFQRDRDQGWRLAQNVLSVLFLAVCIVSVVVAVVAAPFSRLIAPGFSPEDLALLASVLRIMLLSTVLFSVSTVLGGVLQSLERFVAYSVAPILYSGGIIAGALWFAPWFVVRGEPAVYGLAWGVVAGAMLHVALQLAAALRVGFRLRWVADLAHDGFRTIVRLAIPRTLALGVYSVGVLVINAIASTLGSGAITILAIATNLQFVPISVVGISLATAVFPKLSVHAAAGDMERFHERLRHALTRTFWFVGSVTLLMFVFREPLVRLIFASGAFRGADVVQTAAVLGILLVYVVPHSMQHVMTRAFYALQNTRTPFIVAFLSIGVIIGASFLFTSGLGWGVRGLAAATSLGGVLNFALLYIAFRRRYR